VKSDEDVYSLNQNSTQQPASHRGDGSG
jgi:hypothetical protein